MDDDALARLRPVLVELVDALGQLELVEDLERFAAERPEFSVAVAAAERVSDARARLYATLIELGWSAPPGILEALELTGLLDAEGLGANADEPVHQERPRRVVLDPAPVDPPDEDDDAER